MRAKEFIIEAIPLDQLRSVSGKETQANKDIIDRLKKSMPSKPRNFVAKNAKMGGAGQHTDKKKSEKQGDVKHKKNLTPMEDTLSELSTEKLGQYKKSAAADAKKADAEGNYARGDKRFKGINRATNKQFDNDLKKHGQQGVAESVLAELAGYGSNKHYKPLGTFKRYQIYVSKQKFNNLYFIAVAENPRTLDAKFKANGNTPQEAIDALKIEVEKEIDVATKVSGQAILDFNVDFVREILEMSTDTFYAKIIPGPKLVIAGSEMMRYPDIMKDEGFKSSTIRTYRGGEGTTKLPGVPLSAKSAMSANLIANGRYVLGTEHIDKDENRVFDLEFDSVVQASNDKMRLRSPAVTVGTTRPKDVYG
jgi:hypothetical protein